MRGRTHTYKRHMWAKSGFTIVETLIVLAVTMAILASALLLVNGKQNRTAFAQSIQDMRSSLQQTISEVSGSYYPNDGSFTCRRQGNSFSVDNSISTEQGKNSDCLFLGKAVVFRGEGRSDDNRYYVYTVGGLRPSAPPFQPQTLAEAAPNIVGSSTHTTTSVKPLLNTLTLHCMRYGTGGDICRPSNGTKTASIIFLGSINAGAADGTLSGSQKVDTYILDGSDYDAANLNPVEARFGSDANYQLLGSDEVVALCFNSGGTNQSGLITINNSGRSASPELAVFNKRNCEN